MGFLSGLIPWNLIHDQRVKDTEQNRISNEEFQWNETMADMHNEGEIGRQSDFLKGMVPASAESYNSYQDATYGEDTQRQQERMSAMATTEGQALKDKAAAAGMSPWEMQGVGGGSSPLPAGEFLRGQAKNTSDLNTSNLMAVKMQTDAQMKVAAMQSDTAMRTTAMQTGNQYAMQNKSPAGKQNIALTAAQEALAGQQQNTSAAQESLAWSQKAVADNQAIQTTIATLASNMPTNTVKGKIDNKGAFITPNIEGSAERTGKSNWPLMNELAAQLYQNQQQGGKTPSEDIVKNYVTKMSNNAYEDFRNEIGSVAQSVINDASKFGKAAGQAATQAGQYLKGQK